VFTLAKDRIKLVFSGDTMPSANLEKHGKDADILVHECTFEDGMEVGLFLSPIY
jgi:ribonuclease BN (tRNA processing enzyme)